MQINEAAVEEAYQQFVASTPEFLEYRTVHNCEAIVKYIITQWGPESGAEQNPSSWEIAFAVLKQTTLVKNPDYVDSSFKARVNSMSGEDVRILYNRDPTFKEQFDRYSRETVPVSATTNDLYADLTGQQYKSIPPQKRAELFARDIMFRAATERLIQGGEI